MSQDIDSDERVTLRHVSNVLSEEKKQQVIALGRLDWSLRRIEAATGVRRETAAGYLRAAGIALRPPGGWGRRPSKRAIEVTTDFGAESAAAAPEPSPDRSPSSSACEPYRESIELGLSRDRNAVAIWQDLVDGQGFAAGYQAGAGLGIPLCLKGVLPVLDQYR